MMDIARQIKEKGIDITKDQDNVFIKLQTSVKSGDTLKRDLEI